MKKLFGLLIMFLSIFICSKVYAYKSYQIGDKVTYNDIDYYVIRDSSSDSDYITLLKATPLTVDEVNLYGGVGTENNHVNEYVRYQGYLLKCALSYNDNSSIGIMEFYTSNTCGFTSDDDSVGIFDGCLNDYNKSDVKYVVDAWAIDNIKTEDLKIDSTGYSVRMINTDDLINNLGYEMASSSVMPSSNGYTPTWVYGLSYAYWTMDAYKDSSNDIMYIESDGMLNNNHYHRYSNPHIGVRPVINLKKSLYEDISNEDIKNDVYEKNTDELEESKKIVNVPNTLKSVSGLIILIGMVLVCVGLNIFIIVKNKDRKKD